MSTDRELLEEASKRQHTDSWEAALGQNTLDDRIRAFLKGGAAQAADTIPEGWALSGADFSVIAGGGSKPGNVTLVRAGDDRKNWHAHADADEVPLYVYGLGMTYDEALRSAIKLARAAPPVPKGGA